MRHRSSLHRLIVVVVVAFGAAHQAQAQDDVLASARTAATTGHRAEALTMLESRLAASPRDVDARLLYGLVLSWERRYDDARVALEQVLTQTPDYTDARVALMNVEYWSGRSAAAHDLATEVLARNPGNPTARAIYDRLESASRPWSADTSYTADLFTGTADPWHEYATSLTRRTPAGSVAGRVTVADRFNRTDQLLEMDFYPRFRPGTYAWVNVGGALQRTLYPDLRAGFELYQSLGRGFEVSGGARYLRFSTSTPAIAEALSLGASSDAAAVTVASGTEIYTGMLTKYIGNWMLTGRVYRVPADGGLDSTSFHGNVRRYFGGDGTSYVGAGYGHGLSREEVHSVIDLLTLHADTIRGGFDVRTGNRLRISASGSTSHQERANRNAVWQTTLRTGISVEF